MDETYGNTFRPVTQRSFAPGANEPATALNPGLLVKRRPSGAYSPPSIRTWWPGGIGQIFTVRLTLFRRAIGNTAESRRRSKPRERSQAHWGWRIPFLLSLLLILLGLWIRARVAETPYFLRDQRRARTATPLLEVMRRCPTHLALVFGARVGETMQFNITAVFALHYTTQHLRISPSVFLGAITIANLVSLVLIPAFGGLSDKVGRRPIAILGGVAALAGGLAFFPMLATGSGLIVSTAVVMMIGLSAGLNNAVPASWFPELFPVSCRYTGISVAYQLGTVAGGTTPAISTVLFARFGVNAVAIYLAATGALITRCVSLLPETASRR
jgi:MFS transporter, MHS family, shikimate and dehydroshikimate transport protein